MKIKVLVEETLIYRHELVIEADEEVSESKLDRILNRAERESDNLDDVQIYLEESGFDVTNVIKQHHSSPNDWKVEITDVIDVD